MSGLPVGSRYGRLTVLGVGERVQVGRNTRKTSLCQCDCGKVLTVRDYYLTGGNTTSCGCLKREGNNYRHGMAYSREHGVYTAMKQRCNNPRNHKYPDYGGRGIRVCRRWEDSFANFLNDMGPCPGDGYSIERVEVDGDYDRWNCYWANASDQQRNKQNTPRYYYQGRSRSLIEICELEGVPRSRVYDRMHRLGWTLEEALACFRKK